MSVGASIFTDVLRLSLPPATAPDPSQFTRSGEVDEPPSLRKIISLTVRAHALRLLRCPTDAAKLFQMAAECAALCCGRSSEVFYRLSLCVASSRSLAGQWDMALSSVNAVLESILGSVTGVDSSLVASALELRGRAVRGKGEFANAVDLFQVARCRLSPSTDTSSSRFGCRSALFTRECCLPRCSPTRETS